MSVRLRQATRRLAGTLTNLGFSAAILIVLAATWIAYRSVSVLEVTAREVALAQRVQTYLERTLADVENAESAQRGYLITAQEQYVSDFAAARTAVAAGLTSLRSAVERPEDVNRLEGLIQRRLALLQVLLRDAPGLSPAEVRTIVRRGTGAIVMDSVRATVEEMVARERRSANERALAARALATRSVVTFAAGNAVAILLLMLAWRDRSREVKERRRREIDLLAAKRSADAASEAKTQFLATMSHEIRTPLNAIIGMTELIRETPLSSEQAEFSRMVSSNAEALLFLVNDLLDSVKIEAGQVDIEQIPFDVRDVVDSVLMILSVRAEPKGLELVADLDPALPGRFVGDPNRLRQVLMNLIGNAIKFTDAGEVLVQAEASGAGAEDRRELRIAVTDTGVGISPANQQRVFERFVQVDASTARRFSGTGLGLNISRALVQLMGGSIHLESTLGRGSTFEVRLPLSVSSAPPGLPSLMENSTHVRVLLGEESESSRRVIVRVLEAAGADVTAVASAEGLGELLGNASATFDIVVLAESILRALQQAESGLASLLKGGGIPPMLVLRNINSASHGLGEEEGVRDCVFRPVEQRRLLEAVRAAIRISPGLEPAPQGASFAPGPAPRRACILLAEDNRDNWVLATRLLTAAGFDVDLAENGAVAVEKAAQLLYDLILMDLEMPVMDGLTATKHIRAHERRENAEPVPIVALTAHAMEGYREQALASGMDDFTTKPIQKEQFIATVRRWIDMRPLVLMVDDAPESHALIRNYLKGQECRVISAYNGADGVTTFTRRRPSVVLMDVDMPIMNGYDATRAIRRSPGGQHVPIIAMTGYEGRDERQKSLAAGCSFHMAKPIRRSDITDLLRGLLGSTASGPPAAPLAPNPAAGPRDAGSPSAGRDEHATALTRSAAAPQVPVDNHRLAALRSTGILDTPPQESLDRFTRLASTLIRVPVSLVSLVDKERQFFASQTGLREPWASSRETPLSHSFCKHVVVGERPLIVDDARESPELRDNPAIQDLGVIAYAGFPIRSASGHILGSFCAIDQQPRHWTSEELSVLRDLADAVSTEIHLRNAAGHRSEPSVTSPEGRIAAIVDADLLDLAPAYLESRREDVNELRASLARGDLSEVQRIGHKLKGSGRSYGFPEISNLGRELEAASGRDDTAMIMALIDRLESYLTNVVVLPPGG